MIEKGKSDFGGNNEEGTPMDEEREGMNGRRKKKTEGMMSDEDEGRERG